VRVADYGRSFAEPRIWVLDVRAPYDPLRRFGVRLRLPSSTVPAVSPTFPPEQVRGCKPGDPPPPSRPAAAGASDRIRSLSRPIPGLQEQKETVMIIGNFTYGKAQDTYTGEL
jgi:hypothetical protein